MPKATPAKSTRTKKETTTTRRSSGKTTGDSRTTSPGAVTPEDRDRMIQYAAYHIAEKDGFKSGKENEYWLQAERQIDSIFTKLSH
jgi:hypothetical protein